MKMFKTILILGGFALLMACGASKEINESNLVLDQMMEDRSFKIDMQSVEPQLTQAMTQVLNSGLLPPVNSISRIDVTGSRYFIEVQGDSVAANLPYYGERQMGGGYTSDVGIKFNGITKNLVIEKVEGKPSYTATFSVNGDSETYFVTTTIEASLNAVTAIRSSHRNRIRYSGRLEKL